MDKPLSAADQVRSMGTGRKKYDYGPGRKRIRQGEFRERPGRNERLDAGSFVIEEFWQVMLDELDQFEVGDLDLQKDILQQISLKIRDFVYPRMQKAVANMRQAEGKSEVLDYLIRSEPISLWTDESVVMFLLTNIMDAIALICRRVEAVILTQKYEHIVDQVRAKMRDEGIESLAFVQDFPDDAGELEYLRRQFASYVSDRGSYPLEMLDLEASEIGIERIDEALVREIIFGSDFVETINEMSGIENHAVDALGTFSAVLRLDSPDRTIPKMDVERAIPDPSKHEIYPQEDGAAAMRYEEQMVTAAKGYYDTRYPANPLGVRMCPARAAAAERRDGSGRKTNVTRAFTRWVVEVLAEEFVPLAVERY